MSEEVNQTPVPLRDALSALTNKIELLAGSQTATAEDLAMLGTALERVGGRASIVEIEYIATELINRLSQELEDFTAQKSQEVNQVGAQQISLLTGLDAVSLFFYWLS